MFTWNGLIFYPPAIWFLSMTVSCLLSLWLSLFPPNAETHESAELERARIFDASSPGLSAIAKFKVTLPSTNLKLWINHADGNQRKYIILFDGVLLLYFTRIDIHTRWLFVSKIINGHMLDATFTILIKFLQQHSYDHKF